MYHCPILLHTVFFFLNWVKVYVSDFAPGSSIDMGNVSRIKQRGYVNNLKIIHVDKYFLKY